jgi:hypothetical protein
MYSNKKLHKNDATDVGKCEDNSHTHTHKNHQNLTQMGRVRENFLLEYLDQLW